MSKKRKVHQADDDVKVKSDEVSYRVFFHKCVIKGLVKSWQEKDIQAFFRDLGLRDKEPLETYKDALEKY